MNPHSAAHISHQPGALLSPVSSTSAVEIAGVRSPKMAVARLKASEKPTVRTCTGITSVSAATIAPLYMPKKNENHSRTSVIRVKSGATVSQCITGQVVSRASTVMPISTGRRPIRSEIAPLAKFHINSPDKAGMRKVTPGACAGRAPEAPIKKPTGRLAFQSQRNGELFFHRVVGVFVLAAIPFRTVTVQIQTVVGQADAVAGGNFTLA